MSACGQLKLSSLLLYTLKKKKEKSKKPSRQCDEASGRARGGWSEVWALQVAINGPRGFDL